MAIPVLSPGPPTAAIQGLSRRSLELVELGQAKWSCTNKPLCKSPWFTTIKDDSVFISSLLQVQMAFQDQCSTRRDWLCPSRCPVIFNNAFTMITAAGRESAGGPQAGSPMLTPQSNFWPLARTSHRALPSCQEMKNAVFHVPRRVKDQILVSTCHFYPLEQWLLNPLKIICSNCRFFWRQERDLSFHWIL